MDFGRRICEILAVVRVPVLTGVLVWYLSSAIDDRGYEREGALVWEEQNTIPGEEAYSAFVTDPASRMYGE